MKRNPFSMSRMTRELALLCVAIIATVLLPSCASTGSQGKAKQADLAAQRPTLYEWNEVGEGAPGPAKIRIELDEQKAYIYKGGEFTAWTYLASGRENHRTPRGTFRIMEKQAQKASSEYGMIVDANGNVIDRDATNGEESIPPGGRFVGAPMPHWMRLTGYGIGMHAGNIPNPGMPASHGCIRLPADVAAKLYEVVDVGTEVTISGEPRG
jgi:hypothetical protein